jgi:hypothetical protein
LPDATTLEVGREFVIVNAGTEFVPIKNHGTASSVFDFIAPGEERKCVCTDISTAAGVWKLLTASQGPVKNVDIFDDFDFNSSAIVDGWVVASLNGGSVVPASNTNPLKYGRAALLTGANAAGGVAFRKSTTSICLGSSPYLIAFGGVNISVLDDGTDTYFLDFGTGDVSAAGEHTDALILRYDKSVSSNWQAYAVGGGTVTGPEDTGVAVSVADIDGIIVISSDASRCDYYINKAKVATLTTNIPTGSGELMGVQIRMHKTGGTNSRTGYADYCRIRAALAR